MSFETVLYEAADGIARITMNRPEKHNALNHQMMDDLDAAFAKAGADDSVAAVVLKGNGPSFCSGYDLKGGSYYITPPHGAETWKAGEVDGRALGTGRGRALVVVAGVLVWAGIFA